MADMLNNAVSGLLSFQRALNTTSHNIANASTEGYSKQVVSLGSNTPSFIGDTFLGNGVNVDSVRRLYDQFLTSELRTTTAGFSKLDFLHELSGHVDNVLADSVAGISSAMHDFFSAVQGVADDPSSTTARYNLINVANSMTDRFHNLDTRFDELQTNTGTDIRTVVDEINNITRSIAEVNIALNKNGPDATSNQQSADLLDERDRLILQLSEKIDISVINENNSSLSIFIGNGQTVLSGLNSFDLEAVPNPADPSQDYIIYNGLNQVFDLSDSLRGGGELGALLEFRDDVLIETRNDLGRVAIAIADTFNDMHAEGMDLNNDLGTDFFSFSNPQVQAFSNNAGTASITSSITDVSALTRYDYTLDYDGTNWTMTSESGSVSTPVAHNALGTATIVFEGITVNIDGLTSAPVAGDQFKLKPAIVGAGSINVEISDPLLIAAASAVRMNASLDNLGTTAIADGEVIDASNANLRDSVDLTFNSATTFTSTSIVTTGGTTYAAGASIPFTNNMTIESNGWQTTLSGVPQTNDVLSIESNDGGVGDNRNALALANLQVTGILDGGNSSYQEAYSTLVGRVGTQTAAAETQRDSIQALMLQARDRLDSKVAVNLDEEAADLVRYQQAYEAASQVISTLQTLFESLLNATR